VGNAFKNIALVGEYTYRGTIAIEGCHDCAVQDNTLENIDDVFALHRTGTGGLDLSVANAQTVLFPQRIELSGNEISRAKGNLYNAQGAIEMASDLNQFCIESPEVLVSRAFIDLDPSSISEKLTLGYDEWQAMGYDLESEMNGIDCAMDGE
ncbi:MAG: hypothetical protein QGI45_08245, partial [Myxococcota bacterium]|nr:hypothetical protein [Myxococcota bacterium]